jgi:hypothetical protein
MELLRAAADLVSADSPLHRFMLAGTLLVPFNHSSGGGLLWPLETS